MRKTILLGAVFLALAAMYVYSGSTSQIRYESKLREADQLVLQLEKYKERHGEFPEELSQLSAEFPEVGNFNFRDSVVGKPVWVYKKTASEKSDPYLLGFRFKSSLPGYAKAVYWMHSRKQWTDPS